MKLLLLLFIAASTLSTGCSFKMPMNPEEFKKMLPESMFGKTEDYNVNRSLYRIKKTFRAKTNKCFKKSVKRTSCMTNGYGHRSCSTTTTHYNPKIKNTKNGMQLTIQNKIDGNVIMLGGKPPKGGMYTLVADITKVKKNKTNVKVYYGWAGSDMFVKTIKRWTNGKTRGCPDLTKN